MAPAVPSVLVLVLASVVAVVSARHAPSSWNDSSRIATVESLVDYRTFAIDQSVFQDTGDRVFIDGHYYSHKPPVPSLLMAALYQGLQWTTGLSARAAPGRFYRWITIGSAGGAYVVAVWCLFQLAYRVGLSLSSSALLTASFGIATLALPYTRAINEHIMLLAVATMVLLCLSGWAGRERSWAYLVGIGFLAGLGYAIESGAGLPLLVSLLALVSYRSRSKRAVAWFVVGALPWLVLHHVVNYSIGGTFVAVAMVPAFFQWPGSPFLDATDLTGAWNHPSFGGFLAYAVGLLFGAHGFILHNLPLWVAGAGVVPVLRRATVERPEIACVLAWSACTWLLYAALSTNYSGWSVSVRWFLPLLAAGFYVLAISLREYPHIRRDVVILSAVGSVWALNMWRKGPWTAQPYVNWTFLGVAAIAWCCCHLPWERTGAYRWARRRLEGVGRTRLQG